MRWFGRKRRQRDEFDEDEWARQMDSEGRERRAAVRGREELVAEVSRILCRADPAGVAHDEYDDEYDAEAQVIVIELAQATSVEEVSALTHRCFVDWFDADTAGNVEDYRDIAGQILEAQERFQAGSL